MRCLRSGYCCINYDVVIVDDPKLGLVEGNVIHKPHGEQCQHLKGSRPGDYRCEVHEEPWFLESPCGQYGQVENSPLNPCRMGEYILDRKGGRKI